MMKKCLRALSCGKKKKSGDDEHKNGTPGRQRTGRTRRSASPIVTSPRFRYSPSERPTVHAPPTMVRSMSPQLISSGGESQRLLGGPPMQVYGSKGKSSSMAQRSASIKSMTTATGSIRTSQSYRTGSAGAISTLPSRRSASRTPLVTPAFPTSSPNVYDMRSNSHVTTNRELSPVDKPPPPPPPPLASNPSNNKRVVQDVEFVDVLDELVKRRAAEPHRFIIEEDCTVIKSIGTKGAPCAPPQHLGTAKSQVMPVVQRSPPRNVEVSPIWNTGATLSVHSGSLSLESNGSERGCPSTSLPMTSVFGAAGRSSTVCSETNDIVSVRHTVSVPRQQSVWSDKKIPPPPPNEIINNPTTVTSSPTTNVITEPRVRNSVGIPEQLTAAWNGPTVWRDNEVSHSPDEKIKQSPPPFAASHLSSVVSLPDSVTTQRPSTTTAQHTYKPQHKDTSTSISPARVTTLLLDHGDEYQGTVKEGIPHGSGTMRYTNGNSYSGELRDGLKWGSGIFRWRNGDFYEGDFENDVFQGSGMFVFANSSVTYAGLFKNGMFCGDMPAADNLDRTAPAQAPSPATLRSSSSQDQHPVVQLHLSAPDADELCPQWPDLSWGNDQQPREVLIFFFFFFFLIL